MRRKSFLKILSITLIFSFLLSLSACQPPDYETIESTSAPIINDLSTSEQNTTLSPPDPFGSTLSYSGSLWGDAYQYCGVGIYFVKHSHLYLLNRVTNQYESACMHKADEDTCVFCKPGLGISHIQVYEGKLYGFVANLEDATDCCYLVCFDPESGTIDTIQVPYDNLLYPICIADGNFYYTSLREDDTGDYVYEVSRTPLDGGEREVLYLGDGFEYVYGEKGFTDGYRVTDLQSGESTPLLSLEQLGAETVESYFYYEGYSYLSVKNPETPARFDLYRISLKTGEYEKLLEKINSFCIMKEGIYYRVSGEYESKYVDADGKHPKRFERDLYRCDLDGSNAEVVFSDPDMVFMDLIAVIDGYAYGEFRIMTSAKDKKIARFALHLATGTYQEIIPYSDADVVG